MEQQLSEAAAAAAGYDELQCPMSNTEMEPRTKKPNQLDPDSAFFSPMDLSPTSGSPRLRLGIFNQSNSPGVTENQTVAAGDATGSPSLAGGLSPFYSGSNPQSATEGQSPDSPRLQIIRDSIEEMYRKFEDVDDETPEERNHNNAAASQDGSGKQVSVEKSGEGQKIKVRCTCGCSYEILVFGQTCYYKL